MTWTAVLEGTALQAALVGLAGFTAHRAARAVMPTDAGALELWWLTGLMGILGWVALLQLMGLAGVLRLPAVLGMLAVLALLATRLPTPGQTVRSRWPELSGDLLAVAIPLAALSLVVVLSAPPGVNSYDTVHYQIPNAAHILDTGSIRTLPFALPGEGTGAAPGNGSLLLLAVMLPFHTAGLTGLVNPLCALLIVLATGVIGQELGGSRRTATLGMVAGLTTVCTVDFFVTQMRSDLDDSLALLGFLSGIAAGLRAARLGRRWWLVLAGASLGLAAGAKAAYLLPALIAGTGVLWTTRAWRHGGSIAALLGGAAALSLTWYARNWVITGDPLFPEPVQLGAVTVFGGLRGAASATRPYEQTLLGALLGRGGTSPSMWTGYLIADYGPLLAAPLLSLPAVLNPHRAVRMLAVIAAACAVAYMVTPFSGSSDPNQVNAALRFLLPSVAASMLALSAALPVSWYRLLAAAGLGTNGILLLLGETQYGIISPALLLAGLAVSILLLAAVHGRKLLRRLFQRPAFSAGMGTLAAGGVLLLVAHLQAAQDPSPAEALLLKAAASGQPVVAMDVGDVTAILGPDLTGNAVAAGDGPVGAERPIRNVQQLDQRIEALQPPLVAVGHLDAFNVVPTDWTPPAGWRLVGSADGFTLYRP
jgi:hypothetical protein